MAVHIKKGMALASLNITPLIDVVFLLLIFFLVATRFAEEEQEMDMPLPSASEAVPLAMKTPQIFVNIDKSGRYFLNLRVVDENELQAHLQRAAINNPVDQQVVIRADKRVEFQHPITVMNICKKVGIAEYVVTTEGTEE